METKQLFAQTIEQAASCVRNVHDDQLAGATPCTEWDLKTLLNHMVNELLWMPELLRGKTIAEVGDQFDGDLLGNDAAKSWQRAADAALAAVKQADLSATVHLSYGDFPAAHYIAEMATDVLIHGWDVAQSMRCSQIFDPAVAQAVYDKLEPNIQGYRDGGFMGPSVEIPADSGIQSKLLAMVGRHERT